MVLYGAVDFASSPAIGGWVSVDKANSEPPVVEAIFCDAVVGAGAADLLRKDLKDGCYAFRLLLSRTYSLSDLSSGRLNVVVRQGDSVQQLRIWNVIETAGRLEETIVGHLPNAIRLLAAPRRRAIAEAFAKFYGGSSTGVADTGLLGLGAVSEDETAVIGRNGHLFLYQGSNRVLDLYEATCAPQDLVRAWASVYKSRAARLRSQGVPYIQILIPEKSSVLPHLVPYSVSGPSMLWQDVVHSIQMTSVGGDHLVDAHSIMLRTEYPEVTYCLQDSHLSSFGSQVIVEEIIQKYFGAASYRLGHIEWEDRVGDLGRRFRGANQQVSAEKVRVLDDMSAANGDILAPKLIESIDPADGNQGCRRVWTCDDAPIKSRAVCFGNSFFERGRTSTHLSWWFSRLFREFHFVWSADFDWAYVDRTKPDIVIGQTIERFLRRNPKS
jgi:hypothetical protein